mmetsp:Transcript_19863/g.62901  ORF Transcript_19863/g.62901 Transcript_19863/m.62901 type:complete len:398 (-) Transcript_19863:1926-3119(-)
MRHASHTPGVAALATAPAQSLRSVRASWVLAVRSMEAIASAPRPPTPPSLLAPAPVLPLAIEVFVSAWACGGEPLGLSFHGRSKLTSLSVPRAEVMRLAARAARGRAAVGSSAIARDRARRVIEWARASPPCARAAMAAAAQANTLTAACGPTRPGGRARSSSAASCAARTTSTTHAAMGEGSSAEVAGRSPVLCRTPRPRAAFPAVAAGGEDVRAGTCPAPRTESHAPGAEAAVRAHEASVWRARSSQASTRGPTHTATASKSGGPGSFSRPAARAAACTAASEAVAAEQMAASPDRPGTRAPADTEDAPPMAALPLPEAADVSPSQAAQLASSIAPRCAPGSVAASLAHVRCASSSRWATPRASRAAPRARCAAATRRSGGTCASVATRKRRSTT